MGTIVTPVFFDRCICGSSSQQADGYASGTRCFFETPGHTPAFTSWGCWARATRHLHGHCCSGRTRQHAHSCNQNVGWFRSRSHRNNIQLVYSALSRSGDLDPSSHMINAPHCRVGHMRVTPAVSHPVDVILDKAECLGITTQDETYT